MSRFITFQFDESTTKKESVLLDLFDHADLYDPDEQEEEPQERSHNYGKGHPRNKRNMPLPPQKEKVTRNPKDEARLRKALEENLVEEYFGRGIFVNFSTWPILDVTRYCEENCVSPLALEKMFGLKASII